MVAVPVPSLVNGPVPEMPPVSASDAPVFETFQVCSAPTTNGAEMVTLPALAAREIPSVGRSGVNVILPPVPGAIVTAVTGEGLAVNCSEFSATEPSSVVLIVGPDA